MRPDERRLRLVSLRAEHAAIDVAGIVADRGAADRPAAEAAMQRLGTMRSHGWSPHFHFSVRAGRQARAVVLAGSRMRAEFGISMSTSSTEACALRSTRTCTL